MNVSPDTTRKLPEGWSRPQPEHLPKPTAWPAALALGATLLVWGWVTVWVVLVTGAVLFVVSLIGWIQDIRKERHELDPPDTP